MSEVLEVQFQKHRFLLAHERNHISLDLCPFYRKHERMYELVCNLADQNRPRSVEGLSACTCVHLV